MIPHALIALPDLSLRALVAALRDGPMKRGLQTTVVQSIVGGDASEAMAALRALEAAGFSITQIALLLDSLLAERAQHPTPEAIAELVLSGPEVQAVPMQDTAAVMQSLVRSAQREILLVGYAVHDGRTIFRDVAERMDELTDLKVTLCLNVHRGGDTSAAPMLVHRFVENFLAKDWPGTRVPDLYYYPAALELDASRRAVLHAKCVVVDRARALVTSANFTGAAQQRNIELGVLVQHAPIATRIADYFAKLADLRTLVRSRE